MYLMRSEQQDSNFVVPDAGVNIPNSYQDDYRCGWDWSSSSAAGDGHWRPGRSVCSRSRSSDGVHRLATGDGSAYIRNALDPLHVEYSSAAAAAHVPVPRRSRYLSIGTLSTKPLSDYRFCLSSETLSAGRKLNAVSSVV